MGGLPRFKVFFTITKAGKEGGADQPVVRQTGSKKAIEKGKEKELGEIHGVSSHGRGEEFEKRGGKKKTTRTRRKLNS